MKERENLCVPLKDGKVHNFLEFYFIFDVIWIDPPSWTRRPTLWSTRVLTPTIGSKTFYTSSSRKWGSQVDKSNLPSGAVTVTGVLDGLIPEDEDLDHDLRCHPHVYRKHRCRWHESVYICSQVTKLVRKQKISFNVTPSLRKNTSYIPPRSHFFSTNHPFFNRPKQHTPPFDPLVVFVIQLHKLRKDIFWQRDSEGRDSLQYQSGGLIV